MRKTIAKGLSLLRFLLLTILVGKRLAKTLALLPDTLNDFDDRIEDQESHHDVGGEVYEIHSDIGSMQDEINDLSSEVGDMRDRLDSVENDIAEIRVDMVES